MKTVPEKILENDIIDILMDWLKSDGWKIISFRKFRERGIDILAEKKGQTFIIEAKGAKGNPENSNTTRPKFDAGQLKTHLGVAVIKVLEERLKCPGSLTAIAHPDVPYIRSVISSVIPEFEKLGIRFLWVNTKSKRVQ